jgi:hypothetical protein
MDTTPEASNRRPCGALGLSSLLSIVLMLCIGGSLNASFAADHCARENLRQKVGSEKELIRGVQRKLEDLGFYKNLRHSTIVDGVVGIDTQCALQRYCRNRIAKEPSELINDLIDSSPSYPPDRFGLIYSIDSETLKRLESTATSPDATTNCERPIAVQESEQDQESERDQLFNLYRIGAVEEGLKRIEGREYLSSRLFEAAVREAVAGHLREEWTEQDIFKICPQSEQGEGSDDCDPIAPADSCAAALTAKYSDELSGMASVKDPTVDTPVRWSGCGSGCVIEREGARGVQDVLYGFYPFWGVGKPPDEAAAGSEQTGPESDGSVKEGMAVTSPAFDILSRIGYFAFQLDDQGEITGDDRVDPSDEHFYDVAHRHGTRVDMVLYKDDWESVEGDRAEKELFFSKARESIREKLQTKSEARLPHMLPYLTLSLSERPPVWDGVTLYFRSLPEQDADLFHSFIEDLRNDIQEIGEDVYINLMLSFREFGSGIYQYQHLCKLVWGKSCDPEERGDADKDYVDLFIILLEEPTTETKKILRREIEDNFKGVQRRDMLGKIVPVISPLRHDKDFRGPYVQFEDDLIYFQWNFAGVGFWPLITRDQDDFDDIQEKMVDVFEDPERLGMLGALASTYVPQLCDFACPNRWWVQIAFDIVVLSWVALWVFALSCSCGRTINWFVWGSGLAALGIGLVSLTCDPLWRGIDVYVLVGIVLIIVVWVLTSRIRRAQQAQQP